MPPTRHQKREREAARAAALEVLLHNMRGPYHGLPRTAGWGYPEPYTRDLMLAIPGVLVSGHEELIGRYRRVLEVLAQNQSPHGHIPSLAHDADNRGASDTTPLFLWGVGLYRKHSGERNFLNAATRKALTWMAHQSPDDRVLVAQLPTSDWRDEHWVMGYGLYVNTIVYAYLRLLDQHEDADLLYDLMNCFEITAGKRHRHVHRGLRLRRKPYYGMQSYKIYNNERFDLLGNCLAMLTGVASQRRSKRMVAWVEAECRHLRGRGELAVDLPPVLIPFIREEDPDWRPRYEQYNRAGEYHNGGVWPFVCGLYVAACVAAGRTRLARTKLAALTRLVKPWHENEAAWGFNEWIKAQTGAPSGRDWQTWSAAMYLYADACVERGATPFFDALQQQPAVATSR